MSLFGTNLSLSGMSSSIGGTGTTSTTSSGTTGAVASTAIDIAASNLPFGGLISNVLDRLDLANNINNVLKYGLSSWGASATPEEMKKRFAENCYPWLQTELSQMTPDNVEEKLDLLDYVFQMNAAHFKLLRDHHSRAKSTRLANDWAYNECKRLQSESVNGIVSLMKSNGISVTKTQVSLDHFGSYVVYGFWDKDEISREEKTRNLTTAYDYKVNQAELEKFNSKISTIVGKSGGSTMALAAFGILGFFWFKGMKKFK